MILLKNLSLMLKLCNFIKRILINITNNVMINCILGYYFGFLERKNI